MANGFEVEISGKKWQCVPVKIKELKPNPDNPRTITKEALDRLKRKIKRQGFRSAIQVDNNGIILGGNQRYHALMELGYEESEVPVLKPMFQMTQKEREEAIITDNISDGEWNMEMVANQFNPEDLVEWGFDIPWEDAEEKDENGEPEQIDIEKKKVKITIAYTESHKVIDAFLREMHEKHPELLYEVEINDQ